MDNRPVRQIRIRQYTFELSSPYEEGHELTLAEAQALNALRAENIRNNVSRKILQDLSELAPGLLLSLERLEEIQQEITTYDNSYQFALPASDRVRVGALEQEILRVAENAVAQVMEVTDPGWDAALTRAKALPDVRAEALKRLEAKRRIALSSVEDLLA